MVHRGCSNHNFNYCKKWSHVPVYTTEKHRHTISYHFAFNFTIHLIIAKQVTVSVYAGEVSSSVYGFGSAQSNITSPGPTFTVKVGTIVTVDFTNVGAMAHNWALVTTKTSGKTNLAFKNSQIASVADPIQPSGKASTTFVANQP